MKLYVGNIPYAFDDEALRAVFQPYGAVVSARVALEPTLGTPKGYGFVEMADEDALAAMKALNESIQGGRTIHVMQARTKS